jgi:hypothetical protein
VIFLSLLLVLVVALACASFFRNMLAAFLVFLALPVAVLLHALVGTPLAVFAIGLLAIVTVLIHTINDTLRQLRTANRAARRTAPMQRDVRRRPSERSRAA